MMIINIIIPAKTEEWGFTDGVLSGWGFVLWGFVSVGFCPVRVIPHRRYPHRCYGNRR